MLIPVLMLFILGLVVPIFSLLLGFMTTNTPGWGWVAIIVISVASMVGGVVIYIVARLQKRPEE